MNHSIALIVFSSLFVVQIVCDANYAITFDAQAPITQFLYQLSTPAISPDPSNAGDAQGIWAGVTTTDGQTLVQNVIENQDGGPNSWFMKPIYCCSPYSVLNDPVQVYHRDNLQASFIDNSHGNSQDPQWVDSFTITRNPADSQSPFSASISLNTTRDPIPTPFTQAMFVIEVHGLGAWDWGQVVFYDVYIEALTNDTKWCTQPFANSVFQVSVTAPTVQVNLNPDFTLCYIEKIYFNGP